MNWTSRRTRATLGVTAFLVGFALTLVSADDRGSGKGRGKAAAAPPRVNDWTAGLDPLAHRLEDGRLVSDLQGGRKAVLTLHPPLQTHLEKLLARYEVPYGAMVAVEPKSGKVLAYVSHSSADAKAGDLVRDAEAPAASIFKVVTGAALLDAGVSADTSVCYHGGLSGLTKDHLVDNPKRDTACTSLADAMGKSTNAVLAKLAARHLNVATLERYADAFGFGHSLPFDVPTPVSRRDIPADPLEFARTAAGFWHTYLSPLHGALLAATVAADGTMPRASMVEQVVDGRGKVMHSHKPAAFRSVIPRTTARVLTEMMERTVTRGTSRSAFYDPKGNAFLPGIRVAGKTGSLSSDPPYRGYSWWVGFAPADDPKIAVAALIVNSPRWRIKASYAAREALRHYLIEAKR